MEKKLVTSRGIPKAKEVEPIKNLDDIKKIKEHLLFKKSMRNYLLFVVGINVGLRAGDLLELRIRDVFNENIIKHSVCIIEEKTNKHREFTLNNSAKEAIKLYLDSLIAYSLDDYLFLSRKGNVNLKVESAHKIIKSLARELEISGNYGTHTLRKTFGYHTYINNIMDNPGIIEILQKIFNHSSSGITLRYIGITKDVIRDLYNSLNL